MSEIKDRHRCEECKFWHPNLDICSKEIPEPWDSFPKAYADDEACSGFEPLGGWRE